MSFKNKADFIPTLLVNAFFLPLSMMLGYIYRSKNTVFKNFFGVNVTLEKGEEQIELLNELKCNDLMLRVPLSDIKNINDYKEFAQSFEGKNITINIIQDRENIEDHKLLAKNIRLIFSTFKGICAQYQIANAVNKNKWGFFSIKEYLKFYTTVQDVRNDKFPNYTLIGPSVKGFEFQYTVRSLFNYFKIKFDKVSALLYVDKQGYPENPQLLTFDLNKQINTMYGLSRLAIKSNSDIIISEVNWHIKEQKQANEYAVSEEEQAIYLVRYYLLALGSKKIQSVFWFQLISSAFGQTFVKKGKLERRKSFYAFKTMIQFVANCRIEKYSNADKLHVLTCEDESGKMFDVIWIEEEGNSVELTKFNNVYDIYGTELTKEIKITNSPIYAYH